MISKSRKVEVKSICKKLFPIILIVFFFFFIELVPASAQTPKGKSGVVTLNLVSAWTSPDFGNYGLEKFVERVNKQSKTVKIVFKGGAEVIPPLEGFAYVNRGMVDLYHTAATYYAGNLPGALAAFNVRASLKSLRESGFWDLYDKMHRTKGVTILSMLWRGGAFGLFVNKPITTADLKGLKIRSLPMYDSFLRKLGASVVSMPQGDIYTALEKGVVDGFCYPYGPGFMEKSWHEVVKYVVDPQIPYTNSGPLLANLKQWEALPEESRKEVMNVILQMESEIYNWYTEEAPKSIKKAIGQGLLKEAKLPPKEAQIFLAAAKDAMWNDVVTRSPEYGPKLKELGEKAERLEAQKKR
jgi:TRAP-type C4-dicarboxylate transport system substrate-binding protein